MNIALKVHENDNVATVFAEDISVGTAIEIVDKAGKKKTVTAVSPIPYGHKIALIRIPDGDTVSKYGESIGCANMEIKTGEHVHIHNMESTRGRGDQQPGQEKSI